MSALLELEKEVDFMMSAKEEDWTGFDVGSFADDLYIKILEIEKSEKEILERIKAKFELYSTGRHLPKYEDHPDGIICSSTPKYDDSWRPDCQIVDVSAEEMFGLQSSKLPLVT